MFDAVEVVIRTENRTLRKSTYDGVSEVYYSGSKLVLVIGNSENRIEFDRSVINSIKVKKDNSFEGLTPIHD